MKLLIILFGLFFEYVIGYFLNLKSRIKIFLVSFGIMMVVASLVTLVDVNVSYDNEATKRV